MILALVLNGQGIASESVQSRMRRLLDLPSDKTPLAAEILQKSEDGEVVIEDIRFRASRDIWIPAIVVKPISASKSARPLPAIICLPGTGGTRQQLSDARLQLSEHIWGNFSDDDGDSNYIDVHIKNIRKKMAAYAPVDWLQTLRGIGYKIKIQ